MAITWESVCRVPRGIVVFRGTLDLLRIIGADPEYLRQSWQSRDFGANLVYVLELRVTVEEILKQEG